MACIQHEFKPSETLANHINFLFLFKSDLNTAERVNPDGSVEISFQVNPCKGNDERCYVISRFSEVRQVKPADLGEVIGVNVYPWAVSSLLNIPAREIINKKISLENILGSKIKQLHEQVLNAFGYSKAFKLIENFFIKKIHGIPRNDTLVSAVSESIIRSKGTITVKNLLYDYNISERRLEQCFREAIGISPKFYCRLTRFQNALRLLNSGITLTKIAYQCGYFDQSHFINDFKRFSGTSPYRYLHEKHYIDNVNTKAKAF